MVLRHSLEFRGGYFNEANEMAFDGPGSAQ